MEQLDRQASAGAGSDILRIQNVSKRFVSAEGGLVSALDAVSLTISSGRFTTLLGPSGCGKTTLLRAIAGFEEPDGGTIRLGETDITHAPPFERPVSTVFQHYALFPHLSVARNVAYGLEVTGVARASIAPRVAAALSMVRLEGLGGRKIGQLSGGQQQRVALARSLVLQPEVLLLDEPLAALDRNLRKDMQVELKRLQNEVGIAFLCVTHDQEEALSMSDTVVVMNAGRIEQIGSPRDIYERPATRFVAAFVGEASILPCRAAGRRGEVGQFALSDGQTILSADRDPPSGEVVAVVRPERLRLGASRGEGQPELNGIVRQSIYLGEKTRVEAEAAGGRIIALLDGAIAPPPAGDSIRFGYDPADVHLVPA